MKGVIKTFFLLIIFILIFDKNSVKGQSYEPVNIKATKAITIDMNTKEIIYCKDADVQSQPASTTKLMTALLLAENKYKTDLLPFTEIASKQPSSAIISDLLPTINIGDTITSENVMKALLLHSANDMACVIAEGVSKNLDDFSKLMNEKALSLSMNNTNFYTPSGLDSDEYLNGNNHYSTAYDLALLGMAAFENLWVRETMALKENIDFSSTTSEVIKIKNGNRNLNINGCIGGKTGFTSKAGRCLVAIYEREGRKIVGVVLDSVFPDYFNDMDNIINYSYNAEKVNLYNENEEIQTHSITFKPLNNFGPIKKYNIPIVVKDNVSQYKNYINDLESEKIINLNHNILPLNLNEKTILGTLTLKERNISKTFNLYTTFTTEDIIKDNLDLYFTLISIVLSLIIVLLYILILFIITYTKNRKISN